MQYEWEATYNSGSNRIDAKVIADYAGNVFVAGTTLDSLESTDWIILKYDLKGELLWTETYNGSGDDYVASVALDEDDNLIVVGTTATSGNGDDYLIRKYESDGDLVWSKSYDGTGAGHDRAYHVVTDRNSNVYVTGESVGSTTSYDMLTVKYNASGTKLWHARMTGSGNRDDRGSMISVDTSGNVYVTGYKSAASTLRDIATVKYNSSGTQQWLSVYSGSANLNDEGNALVIDSLGNVYVAGKKTISSTNTDYVILKYNSSGSQQWVTTYDGTASGIDVAQSLDVNENLNVFVSGMSADSTATFDIATMRLNANGSVNWIYRYNGPAGNTDLVTQLKIDAAGEIVLTAGSEDATTDMDYLTMCYTAGGTLVWSERYTGTANLMDKTSSLFVDALANIYISGAISVSENHFEYATIKYSQPEKNGISLDNLLRVLAQSLEDISKNDTVKHILNDHARRSVDEYYHIFFPELFESGLDSGLDIKAAMNAKLEDLYPGLATGKDHVAKLIGGLHYRNILLNPHIIMPDFAQIDSVNNEMDDPLIAYSHTRDDYPIPCINCEEDELDRGPPEDYVPVVAIVDLPLSSLLQRSSISQIVRIINCSAQVFDTDPSFQCEVCPLTTVFGGADDVGGGSLNDHEIEIQIGHNNTPTETDLCLFVTDPNSLDDNLPGFDEFEITVSNLGNFGIISKVFGIPAYDWELIDDPYGAKIKKLSYSMIDRHHFGPGEEKLGDLMTLCTFEDLLFNNWGENDGSAKRFALGQGGMFKLTRTLNSIPSNSTGQTPLYFAFPYARSIWWVGGPDMRVYYGTNSNSEYCPETGKVDIEEDYKAKRCWFCATGSNTLGIPEEDISDYIISTNFAEIYDYWSDNVITIGFSRSETDEAFVISPDFIATSNPASCVIDGSWTLISSATLHLEGVDEWYVIENRFPDDKFYQVGDTLIVRVRANFINGEAIDECREITLENSNPAYEFHTFTIQIRGNIENYDETVINYQVDFYEP